MRRQIAALSIVFLVAPCISVAQQTSALPDAPEHALVAQTPAPVPPVPASSGTAATDTTGPSLTRQQAEQLALKNNPRISVAGLLALADKQVTRETRSAEYPTINGELTSVDAEEGSRLSTGTLNAARLLQHAGAGVQLNQLITDFGRTRNLVSASKFRAQASDQQAQATREQIVLAADLAFYRALEAQATLQVASSTVQARKAVGDQVNALTASKLKSTLDQSFAQVNLSQAQLLQIDAQNQYDAAIADLNEVLGTTDATRFTLSDDPAPPAPVASSAEAVINLALQQRPDLLAAKRTHDADERFAQAQKEQLLPTLSGLAVAGYTPWAPNTATNTFFLEDWYGAAGVNLEIPLFNGFKFHAEAEEAALRAKASSEQSRDLVDRIVRDVRTAWLTMTTAHQRMGVTAALLAEANSALDLANTRYRLGLSSIVELSQAQLQQTQAQIEDANARFEYEADLAALRFQSGSQP